MIKILDSNFNRLGVIKNVIEAARIEEINGGNTLDFTAVLDAKLNGFIDENTIFELNDDYFDIALFKANVNEDDTYTIEVESEHISYRLNDPAYNVEYFTAMGTPVSTLGTILAGTDFTIGTVDMSGVVTYSAQEAMSRRQVLMEYAAYIDAELEFNKFEISFLVHRGSTSIKAVIKDRNVKVVSKSIDKRTRNTQGNPTIAYICTPVHIPLDDYTLGDNILLMQKSIGINETLRVVSISRNPYDDMDTTFNFASYTNGLADSLYKIATDAVSKDKFYNGTRIGPEFGFEAIRNDKMARAYLRSDGLALQSGDGSGTSWTDRLYYEYDSELDETVLVFDGKFTADVIEALSMIIAPLAVIGVLYANKGYISELTVDQVETSDKVQRYLNEDMTDVNYIRIQDQIIQFITATVDPLAVPNFEQVQGRNGGALFWTDETHVASGEEETAFPVYIYVYIDTVKMENTFEYDSELEEYVPRISLGLSEDPGSNGTGAIYKGKTGLHIDYNSTTGELRQILMNDAGIILTPLAPVGTMEITADRLITDTKIQNYLNSDTSDVNYISIVDQVFQFITATLDTVTVPNFEQFVNRDGAPLYWFDETRVSITTDETIFPIYIYKYIELVKIEHSFYFDGEQNEYIPRIVLGAGTGEGDNEKGFISKGPDGLNIDYYNSVGDLRQILFNEDGIEFTPETGNTNIAATTLDVLTMTIGEFVSEEWTHGFDTTVDNVHFLVTAQMYDETVVKIADIRVEQLTPTTCRIVGLSATPIEVP